MAAGKLGVTVIYEDGALSPSQALSAFRKLSEANGIQFIVGPFGSDQTMVVAPAAMKSGVLLVAVAMCEPRFQSFPNVRIGNLRSAYTFEYLHH